MIFYIQIYTSITKTPLDIFISGVFLLYRVAKPVEFMGGSWCNWHGKDGICALDGKNVVLSIERMGDIFPHRKDFQFFRTIRSQEFALGETKGRRRASIELRVRG